jgi:hypothetical protein
MLSGSDRLLESVVKMGISVAAVVEFKGVMPCDPW